ncbi:MAG TPA: hypothetical protein VMW12_06045 [Candidatus Dormibacteraeota bacterium]|nr:hypothetical protein [Candidatus Dormibacteraeota bacterium]
MAGNHQAEAHARCGYPKCDADLIACQTDEIVEFEREPQGLGQHADRGFEVKPSARVVARRDAARRFVAERLSSP